MERETFQKHLYEATEDVLGFTRTLVTDELPSDSRYFISHREGFNPSVANGEAFPEDLSLQIAQGDLPQALRLFCPPLDASGVVDDLWRNGKVPDWVNIIVHGADDLHTYFLLRCSGSFTAWDGAPAGRPIPFQLRIPSPPPGWRVKDGRGIPDMKKSLETNGKYPIRNFGDPAP